MIKLTRIPRPVQLTSAEIVRLTEEYKETKKSVWNKDYIKDALSSMSNSKCAYCECKVEEESKYLEVEHFKHKDKYPDSVVDWDNLLPACRRCNGQKSDHDTVTKPIIEPTIINPRDHLMMIGYIIRVRNKSSLGKTTKEVLDLNNWRKLVEVRSKIGLRLHEQLEKISKAKDEYILTTSKYIKTRRRGYVLSCIENLLLECQPDSAYSATAATEVINSPDYIDIKQFMITEDFWSEDLEILHNIAVSIELS